MNEFKLPKLPTVNNGKSIIITDETFNYINEYINNLNIKINDLVKELNITNNQLQLILKDIKEFKTQNSKLIIDLYNKNQTLTDTLKKVIENG